MTIFFINVKHNQINKNFPPGCCVLSGCGHSRRRDLQLFSVGEILEKADSQSVSARDLHSHKIKSTTPPHVIDAGQVQTNMLRGLLQGKQPIQSLWLLLCIKRSPFYRQGGAGKVKGPISGGGVQANRWGGPTAREGANNTEVCKN